MSTRTTVILFAVLFLIALAFVVVLPFLLGGRPGAGEPGGGERAAGPSDQGVFRSDDGGRTWQSKSWIEGQEGSIAHFRVNRIVADPIDPATLYLATDGNGLWISRSRGELWAEVRDASGALERSANVLALAANPVNSREWYVAVFQSKRGRVLRTADGGASFREIYSTPVERYGVFDLHIDAGRGALAIATGQGGLLETGDQGRTWRVGRWFADGIVRLLVNPASPSVRFAVTSRGSLFRTTDGGTTWADITDSYSSFSGSASQQRWLMDSVGTLYLGSKYGLLASRDQGMTFSQSPLIIPPDVLPVLALAVDPQNPARLFVSAASQIYASADGGASWAILASPSAKRTTHLLGDRERPETIYAVVQP